MFTGQLNTAEAPRLRLRQISLGGEPITADILGRLRELFLAARVTQVYATTEIGSCFAVGDGQPGFPSEFLERPIGNVQLMIHEGQLYVRTASGMVDYVDGSPPPERKGDWIATGDFVELRGSSTNLGSLAGQPIGVEFAVPLDQTMRLHFAPAARLEAP